MLPGLHLSSRLPVAAVERCSPTPEDPRSSDVSMTTRALEELDGGLGSCQAGEDLSTLADPCPEQPQEDRAGVTPRLADSSSWPHVSQAEGSPPGSVDARPKKTEKEPVAKVASGPGKERLKTGAMPRSPARRKVQASPPPQRLPPPPPPALSDELPWGDVSLNKCLVLASFVALLGSAFQLCRDCISAHQSPPRVSRASPLMCLAPQDWPYEPPLGDAVAGEADVPAPVPEPWVPPHSAREPAAAPLQLKPEAWAPPLGPPVLEEEEEEEEEEEVAEVPGRREGVEKAAGEKRGPKEPPRKERPRKERPRKQEKPLAAREPPGARPRRWEVREGGHRPWAQDSQDPGQKRRRAWDSLRRPEEDRPPGRRKHRAGKGRD